MPTPEFNEKVEERRKAARKKQRQNDIAKVIATALAVVVAAMIIAGVFLLGAFVFSAITWNLGVVGLAAALGLSVGKISLTTGFGAVFVLMVLRSLLHGDRPRQARSANINNIFKR